MEHNKSQLEAAVIRRVWESESFKQKLLINPKDALKDLGFEVPHHMEVCVEEEHKNKMILVLPENPLGSMNTIGGAAPPIQPEPNITASGCFPSVGGISCPPTEPKTPPAKPFNPPKPDSKPAAPPPGCGHLSMRQ